ncbi:MAG TPA: hypothetical protein VFJ15_07565 [Oleiagrimonas sp.]|nr:hypothetical protein [Oleiagrimonas sp.]
MMLLALALTIAAALVFYLTCAQQNWRRAPWPRSLRWIALVLAAVALVLWCETSGAGAGITAALTAAMLAWTLAPYLGWWWHARSRHGERR